MAVSGERGGMSYARGGSHFAIKKQYKPEYIRVAYQGLSKTPCRCSVLENPVQQGKCLQKHQVKVKSYNNRAWDTGWVIRGSSPGRDWEFLSSPPRPDRFWGPPSLLSNG
jgi:hypothetical protein